MNFFSRVGSLLRFRRANANKGKLSDSQSLSKALEKDKKKKLFYKLQRTATSKVKMEIDNLEDAILNAENPISPNRVELLDIYRETMRDDEVFTNTRNLTNKILASDFTIYRNGKPDEDAKDLLERSWFWDYQRYWIEKIWYGHSLVEFGNTELNEKTGVNEFCKIYLVDRKHVHPWSGQVVMTPYDIKGIPYREKPFKKDLIEMGGDWDLGILLIVAKLVIYKRYALSDWSQYSEKFGMPMIVVQTETGNEGLLKNKEEWLANLGASSYAIQDKNDDITLLETSKTDAFKVYLERANRDDKSIAKVISGQSSTTEEKSFVGSAEVHERILNTYAIALLMQLEQQINSTLMPFLEQHGYPVKDCELKFLDIEKLRKASMQTNSTKADESGKALALTLNSFFGGCCHHHKEQGQSEELKMSENLQKLIAKAVKNIFDKKVKAGDLVKELWQYNVDRLIQAVEKGFGKKYAKISTKDKDYELMQKLRKNIYVYAAFKNHHNVADMVKALDDGKGNIASFADFKAKAEQISQGYNEQYLETEYNTAISQAQMAKKWNDIENQKEAFPLLQYDAVNDDRVRPEHLALDGVTLPVEDPFWDKFYPPNGYNCRCTVRQLADAKIKKPPKNIPTKDIPEAFRNNPAKTGELYADDHPYFENVSNEERKKILAAVKDFEKDQEE